MKRKIKSPGSAPGSWQPASPRSITLCSSGAPLSRFTSKVFFSCIRPSPPQAPHSSPALDKFHHTHAHTTPAHISAIPCSRPHTTLSLSLCACLSLCRSNRVHSVPIICKYNNQQTLPTRQSCNIRHPSTSPFHSPPPSRKPLVCTIACCIQHMPTNRNTCTRTAPTCMCTCISRYQGLKAYSTTLLLHVHYCTAVVAISFTL